MTVQELIDVLNKIEDKSKQVVYIELDIIDENECMHYNAPKAFNNVFEGCDKVYVKNNHNE